MKMFSVQYLRGLAVLIVLIGHSMAYPFATKVAEIRRLGSLGVILFFVISGFIMVYISGTGRFDAMTFLKRRIIRIVPLYWLATLALAVLALIAPSLLHTATFDPLRLLLSLLFIPHFDPRGELAPLLKLGWTLNYEMFFYACFALFAFLDARRRVLTLTGLFVALIAFGAVVPISNPVAVFYTQKDLLAFCLGMWIGLVTLTHHKAGRTAKPAPFAGILGLALTVASFLIDRGGPIGPVVYACQAIGSAGLLLFLLGAEDRIPRLRLPMVLGDASFSIYLVHMYLVATSVIVLRKISPDMPLILLVLAGGLSGGLGGIIVHFLVEKPLLRRMQAPRIRAVRASGGAGTIPPDGIAPALIPDVPSEAGL